MKLIKLSALCFALNGLFSSLAGAADLGTDLRAVQDSWATVNYELQDKAREAGFEALIKDSQRLVEHFPENAESHIWHGIVQSSFAGAKGGLGALGLAEAAKEELEKAIAIDEKALQGSALTSLGTLYAKVPGWPIGFGSDKKARALFEKSLQINPDGLDINYFYAEFLYDDKKYQAAFEHLQKAKAAPPRIGREKADKYRQQEVDMLLAKVEKKLKKHK
ncbi:tetratricopeptide repeat protein [Pseudoalteromonas fenneropenaei]|uniref:Tetratricopeptide repeat protein n=1 Tax=Pseudoalteromonas fenneropenaei TaxID=1737459 RepID=A0ABV7CG04_9GAMM